MVPPFPKGRDEAHWPPPTITVAPWTSVTLHRVGQGTSRLGQPPLETICLGLGLLPLLVFFWLSGNGVPQLMALPSLGSEAPLWLGQPIHPSTPGDAHFPLQFPSPQVCVLANV